MFTVTYSGKEYCFDEFIENTMKFTYPEVEYIIIDNTNDNGEYAKSIEDRVSHLGIEVYKTARGGSSREALARSQNLARKMFLEGDYDYLFSLESDIFPKPNILDKLILHGLDFVGGLYCLGSVEDRTRTLCITVDDFKEKTGTMGTRLISPAESKDWINTGVRVISAGGMGATLLSRRVVEQIAFTFIPGHNGHSDVFYCNTARRKGFIVTVDTDAFCDHKNQDWSKINIDR